MGRSSTLAPKRCSPWSGRQSHSSPRGAIRSRLTRGKSQDVFNIKLGICFRIPKKMRIWPLRYRFCVYTVICIAANRPVAFQTAGHPERMDRGTTNPHSGVAESTSRQTAPCAVKFGH